MVAANKVLLACAASSASALVAPAKSAPSRAMVQAAPISEMEGVTAPFGFFDPLGLAKDLDSGRLAFYREAEIKHGRVAMLAAVGFLFQEQFHFGAGPFANVDSPSYVSFEQPGLNWGLWYVLAVAAGNLEYMSVQAFEPLDKTGVSSASNEEKLFRIRADHVSGDLGFDPMGLKPKTDQAFKNMRTKELNNGRLAMIGIAGMVAQELVSGAKIF